MSPVLAGDADRARPLASQGDDAPNRRRLIDPWAGGGRTVEAACDAVRRDPMNAEAVAWAASLANRSCDPAAAERDRTLVQPGAARA
jgi:hypothetical protein